MDAISMPMLKLQLSITIVGACQLELERSNSAIKLSGLKQGRRIV